jgi:hypothetical protein
MNQSLNDDQVFFFAVRQNNIPVVQQYAAAGFNIDAKDLEGKAALHYACDRGYTYLVKLFLKYAANLNTTDQAGRTPLHYACFSGHKDIIQLLLQNGVPVNAQCQSGFTASHTACANGMMDSIILLCRYDADLSVKDYEKVTPLHLAMQRYKNSGDFDSAKMCYFLQWLRDPRKVDKRGRLPLHRALLNVDFTWKDGIELVVHANPDAVSEPHKSLGLPPFALAAVRRKNNSRKQRDLTSIYELLRRAPHLIPSFNSREMTHHDPPLKRKLDPKSSLQNWTVKKGIPLPKYQIIRRRGRDHEPIFTAKAKVKGKAAAVAEGRTKKGAEMQAASRILLREGIGIHGMMARARRREVVRDRVRICILKYISLLTLVHRKRRKKLHTRFELAHDHRKLRNFV